MADSPKSNHAVEVYSRKSSQKPKEHDKSTRRIHEKYTRLGTNNCYSRQA